MNKLELLDLQTMSEIVNNLVDVRNTGEPKAKGNFNLSLEILEQMLQKFQKEFEESEK